MRPALPCTSTSAAPWQNSVPSKSNRTALLRILVATTRRAVYGPVAGVEDWDRASARRPDGHPECADDFRPPGGSSCSHPTRGPVRRTRKPPPVGGSCWRTSRHRPREAHPSPATEKIAALVYVSRRAQETGSTHQAI